MTILIDIAVALGAFLAAAYCMLLSRRLRALTRLDGDVGAAIAVLSQQVDALTKALETASHAGSAAQTGLDSSIARAETATRSLELMLGAATARASAAGPDPTAATHGNSAPAPHARPSAQPGARPRVIRHREMSGQHS
ncbi:MAG: hypothetical protein JJT99_03250 [Rhodobacteraceae bacterium]|nr:hypothetical protein [Paracoccaceae bacterium]